MILDSLILFFSFFLNKQTLHMHIHWPWPVAGKVTRLPVTLEGLEEGAEEGQAAAEKGLSSYCLNLTEKCDFDGGFPSNLTDNWQGAPPLRLVAILPLFPSLARLTTTSGRLRPSPSPLFSLPPSVRSPTPRLTQHHGHGADRCRSEWETEARRRRRRQ